MDRQHAGAVYQDPLAYLLGLQGIALLRAFSGAYDREFTLARLLEVRELLDSAGQFGDGVEAETMTADLVLCAVALSHLPDIHPVLTEFVRVLRPEGHVVISDSRGLAGYRSAAGAEACRRQVRVLPTWIRLASDYLAAALPLGLAVRRCEEPRRPSPIIADDGTDPYDGSPSPQHVPGDAPNIWALHPHAIAAANAAWQGTRRRSSGTSSATPPGDHSVLCTLTGT
jgi:SAM-dependent methyltransferase